MTKILSCAAVLGLLVASSSSVLAVDAVGAHAKVPGVVAFADLRLVSNNSNRARAALYLAAGRENSRPNIATFPERSHLRLRFISYIDEQ